MPSTRSIFGTWDYATRNKGSENGSSSQIRTPLNKVGPITYVKQHDVPSSWTYSCTFVDRCYSIYKPFGISEHGFELAQSPLHHHLVQVTLSFFHAHTIDY